MIPSAWRARVRAPAYALLGLNAAAFAAWTLPRTIAERNAVAHAAALREEVARERAAVDALRDRADAMAANARDTERLFREVLGSRREALLPVIEELHAAAEQEGLALGNESYQADSGSGGPARFRVQLPVSGSYDQIVGFLGRIERSKHFLVIDDLSLGAGEDNRARLNIRLSAYYREPAAAGAAGA